MISVPKSTFEQALQENLEVYCQPSTVPEANLFQCNREISIARFALNEQAKAFYAAVQIYHSILEDISNRDIQEEKTLTDVQRVLRDLETKSKSLIESASKVTDLIGRAVNIDIDKGALRSMMLSLPSLVKDSIKTITGNGELAEEISLNLNNRISDMMIAIRFSDSTLSAGAQDGGSLQQPTIDELHGMMNSIPSQPTQVQQAQLQ